MGIKFSNFGKAIISSAPTGTGGLSFTVEAGKGLLFPSLGSGDYFYGIFKDSSGNREIVKISARSTDAMTIATGGRGLDGTTARTWAAGDYFVAGICNITMQEVFNANLTAIGTLTSAADKLPYFTGSGAAAVTTFTAAARALLDDANAAAMLTTLGFSTFIQTLINDTDAATARATLGAMGLTGDESISGLKTFLGGANIIGKTGSTTIGSGYIGQITESNVEVGSAVSLVANTDKNVTSILLTAGKWDVDGVVKILLGASTSITSAFGSISLTSNSADSYQFSHRCAAFVPGAVSLGYPVPNRRIEVDGATNVYLIGAAGFTVSTAKAWGYIRARRIS